MRRTNKSKVFFKLLSDEINSAGEKSIKNSLREVLTSAHDIAQNEISLRPKTKWSTGRYANSFRYAVSYGSLSNFKETTYGYNKIQHVLDRIDVKTPQTIVMYNVAKNPENGYPYHLNVDRLGWKTIGVAHGHPVSAKQPFTPTTNPWGIITKVKAALQNHPYLTIR